MQLRRATVKAAAAFLQFVQRLHAHVAESIGDPFLRRNEEWFVPADESWFDMKVRWNRGLVLFAEDPAPVGFLVGDLRPPEFGSDELPQVGVIALIWVEESHRSKGIAKSLISAAEDWFREKGMPYVEVPYTVGTPGAR